VQGIFPKDEAKAVELIRQAAEEGSAAEEFRLGESFDNGRGVSKDLSQAPSPPSGSALLVRTAFATTPHACGSDGTDDRDL
jgi:hypothetical protein